MRIGLEKLDCDVFLNAAIAINDFITENNPDMEKVHECSELIFELASERQNPVIELTMRNVLLKMKITSIDCIHKNPRPCFEKIGDMLARVYLNPDKTENDTLSTLRENCLILHKMFLNEQIGLRGRYRFVA